MSEYDYKTWYERVMNALIDKASEENSAQDNVERVTERLASALVQMHGCGKYTPEDVDELEESALAALKLLEAQKEEVESLKQEIEGHIEDLQETLNVVTEQGRKLKAQEPITPQERNGNYFCWCGNRLHKTIETDRFCSRCGREVKWNG